MTENQGFFAGRSMADIPYIGDTEPANYRFLSLQKRALGEAERHRANGDRHMAEGRPDYAAGSYAKAEKFERKAAGLLLIKS